MMWFYYLIPIIFRFIFLPFWLSSQKDGWVTTTELITGTLIIPIYLLIVSLKSVGKINLHKFFTFLLIMIIISTIGILIGYFNWEISTGLLTTPDSETVLIIKSQIYISATIISVGWIILSLIKKAR